MDQQREIWSFVIRRCAATGALALAIAFVLAVVTSPSAQAQTFTVLHEFSGGIGDGGAPSAGLTVDKAGSLYGTTGVGGFGGGGTVYQLKHKGAGWTFNTLYSFDRGNGDGQEPVARVVFGPDGSLYGTTVGGGHYFLGTVFNLRPSPSACKAALCPWMETQLYAFQGGADGVEPGLGDLTFDQARNIYGTTIEGGNTGCNYGVGCGTVYELTPSGGGWAKSILYAFSGPDGQLPYNGVVFDNVGNLYGTTYAGGQYGYGTVFQLSPSTGESLLHSFSNGADGSYLWAGLIFDQAGNLYGATIDGGSGGGGTVFKLSTSGSYTLLYSFTGLAGSGCGPRANLVMDAQGNLYGTTFCDGKNGYGSVFKLTPSSPYWTYTSLHDFTSADDGANPYSNVIFDASGNLYGTASAGGSLGFGVVWEITP